MDFTVEEIEQADLVVVVGHDGYIKWSSHRTYPETVAMLRSVASVVEKDGPSGGTDPWGAG